MYLWIYKHLANKYFRLAVFSTAIPLKIKLLLMIFQKILLKVPAKNIEKPFGTRRTCMLIMDNL